MIIYLQWFSDTTFDYGDLDNLSAILHVPGWLVGHILLTFTICICCLVLIRLLTEHYKCIRMQALASALLLELELMVGGGSGNCLKQCSCPIFLLHVAQPKDRNFFISLIFVQKPLHTL